MLVEGTLREQPSPEHLRLIKTVVGRKEHCELLSHEEELISTPALKIQAPDLLHVGCTERDGGVVGVRRERGSQVGAWHQAWQRAAWRAHAPASAAGHQTPLDFG